MSELVQYEQLTLDDLAVEANREHALALQSGFSMLEHARRAGKALIEAKARVRHGEWLPWLEDNFEGSVPTADRFMRIARNWSRVTNLEDPSLRRALAAISDTTMEVMSSSASPEWPTPQGLFDLLDREFGFELDVCSTDENAKCERHFTEADNGLEQDWQGICWMNPPYGTTIGAWIRKAWESAQAGATVVCLVPARVDTAWWWDYCRRGEIRFLRGRLRFGDGEHSAPFPSAVVIFPREPQVIWWER